MDRLDPNRFMEVARVLRDLPESNDLSMEFRARLFLDLNSLLSEDYEHTGKRISRITGISESELRTFALQSREYEAEQRTAYAKALA